MNSNVRSNNTQYPGTGSSVQYDTGSVHLRCTLPVPVGMSCIWMFVCVVTIPHLHKSIHHNFTQKKIYIKFQTLLIYRYRTVHSTCIARLSRLQITGTSTDYIQYKNLYHSSWGGVASINSFCSANHSSLGISRAVPPASRNNSTI